MKKLTFIIAFFLITGVPVITYAQSHTEEIKSSEKKEEGTVKKTTSVPANLPGANVPQANAPQPNMPQPNAATNSTPPGMKKQVTPATNANPVSQANYDDIPTANKNNSAAGKPPGQANYDDIPAGNKNNTSTTKPVYDHVPPQGQYQTLPKKPANQPDNAIPGNNNAAANYDDVPAGNKNNTPTTKPVYDHVPPEGQYQTLPKKPANQPGTIIPGNNNAAANYDDVPAGNNNNKNNAKNPVVPKSNYGTIPTDQELIAKEQQEAALKNNRPVSQPNYDDIPASNNNNKSNTKNPAAPKSNYGTIPTDQELIAKEQQEAALKNNRPVSQANYDDIPASNNNNKSNAKNPVAPKSNYGTIPTDQELIAKEKQEANRINNNNSQPASQYDKAPPPNKSQYGPLPTLNNPYGSAPPEKNPYGVVPAEKTAAQLKEEQGSKTSTARPGLTKKPAVKDGLNEKASAEMQATENQKKLQELREREIQTQVNNSLEKKAETKAASSNKTAMTKEKAEADKKMQEIREKEINKEMKDALEKREKEKIEKEKLVKEKKEAQQKSDEAYKKAGEDWKKLEAEKKAAEEKKIQEANEKRLLEEKRKKSHP